MPTAASKSPHWPDSCGHLDDDRTTFLGTIWHEELCVPCDVYLWEDSKHPGAPIIHDQRLARSGEPAERTEVCIRYGKEDREYVSPGAANNFAMRVLGAPEPEYPLYYVTAAQLVAWEMHVRSVRKVIPREKRR